MDVVISHDETCDTSRNLLAMICNAGIEPHVRLCRPSEVVLDLLPGRQGEFVKEDGARVVDGHGRHVATA